MNCFRILFCRSRSSRKPGSAHPSNKIMCAMLSSRARLSTFTKHTKLSAQVTELQQVDAEIPKRPVSSLNYAHTAYLGTHFLTSSRAYRPNLWGRAISYLCDVPGELLTVSNKLLTKQSRYKLFEGVVSHNLFWKRCP